MGIRIKGIGAVATKLENFGRRSSRDAREALKEGAYDVQDLAKRQAPRDKGNLERAIKVDRDRGGINTRIRWFVFVDDNADAGNGNRVGQYADLVHEGLHDLVNGPSDNTRRKQAENPDVEVGPFFLSRAVEKLEPEIKAKIELAIMRALK